MPAPSNRDTMMGASTEIIQRQKLASLMNRTFGPKIDMLIPEENSQEVIACPSEIIILRDARMVLGANNFQLKRGQHITSLPMIYGIKEVGIPFKAIRSGARPTD